MELSPLKTKNRTIDTLPKLLIFITLYFPLSSSTNSDGLPLLALKAATMADPTRALVSWSDADSSPCKWAGITCDQSHNRVTSINLSGKNLTGYIPSEIGALSFLTALDLSRNSFTGPLPHQITALRGLIHLDLSSNNFNGSLPESLSDLTHLEGTLNLSCNAFSGEIPASFGRFPVLVSLDLRRNNLTGKIPQVGSLLNQGPTAFSGNPYLCGFPLNNPCTEPEAQNPNPKNPGISSNGFAANRKIKTGLLTISVISLVAATVLISMWVIKRKRKREGKTGKLENVGMEVLGREEGQKGKFVVLDENFSLDLEDLLRASAYVLGKSRSGIVYRVVVSGGKGDGAPAVVAAVRRLSEGEMRWRLKEFEAEVEAISKVQHPNIVRLKAYYYSSEEKLLISDFVGNGSLHSAIHGSVNTSPPLSWATRLRITQETARALTHIHECSHKKHIHGNIKSSKILLDDDLKPYISGFGLSRLLPEIPKSSIAASRSQTMAIPKSSIPSTVVYVAPEAREAGSRLTQKCDAYSFGIVLLEVLTGRLPDGGPGHEGEGLEGLVRRVFREERPLSEIIDPALLNEVQAKKQVLAAFHVALSCTEQDPDLRPKMRTVSENLDCIRLL